MDTGVVVILSMVLTVAIGSRVYVYLRGTTDQVITRADQIINDWPGADVDITVTPEDDYTGPFLSE